MINENAEDFWNRVKALIKSKNTTQPWVATQTKVSIDVLKSWIFHSRLPDAAQAVHIAQALDSSVEYLVTGSHPTNRNSLIKEFLQSELKKFTDSQ